MMELARTKYSELIPYLALCVFAGLRPSEAEHATWKDIDFATKEIFVAGLKTEQDRRITLHDTCLAWLNYAKDLGLDIRPANFVRKQRAFRAELGIEWVQDVLRHTFATFYKASGHTLDEVRDYLGHMTSKMTRKHYLRSIAKDDATEFWSILPATDSAKT
jgi:integrase